MKNTLLLCFYSILYFTANAQINFWENPEIVNEGVEKPRATFVPYSSKESAFTINKYETPFVKSLNGLWKFHFSEKPSEKPTDFFKMNYNANNWENINVPSNWEMEGFGVPVYKNSAYIFPINPPFVDNDDLPIGSYRTYFTVPSEWKNKEIILHFESIAGAATFWINGQRLGYNKASKTAIEFNITPYLIEGDNLLAIEVFKWSDASYLEDQDFWRLAGIERDVFLIARPKVSLEDFFVIGDLDKSYKDGILNMDITTRNYNTFEIAGYRVKVTLSEETGKTIFSKELPVNKISPQSEEIVSFSQKVSKPKQWNAEFPYLYNLLIELKDNDGNTAEMTAIKTGFRKIEMINNQVYINGVPIIIRGTNLHEHHPITGHTIDQETRIEDLRLMKLHNFNAIRTSHYPQSPEFYKLCDKYGFYVIDEVNIECHGLDWFDRNRHPSFLKEWLGQHMDRTQRMLERDKNHTSIIGWSTGNESVFGPNYIETYNWMKQRDYSRTVQCERAPESEPYSDIIAWMYTSPERLQRYADRTDTNRPWILCEYAHAMGNSTGNFQEYWDIILNSDNLQGGFIWDWVDQGMEAYDPNGRKYYYYGGDMGGDRWQHDDNFCINGIINPDRTVHPGIYQIKKSYQGIYFKPVDIENGKIELINYYQFTDLNHYDYEWTLQKNENIIHTGTFKASGKPGTRTLITIKLPNIVFEEGNEYFINLTAKEKYGTQMVPTGHVVASEQIQFPNTRYLNSIVSENAKLIIERDNEYVKFTSGEVSGAINLSNGLLTDYKYRNKRLITSSPVPNFWRAPNDNDFGENFHIHANIWRTAGNDREVVSFDVKEQNEGTTVDISFKLKYINVDYLISYHIMNDGAVKVTSTIDMKDNELPELPRFGMKMQIPLSFNNVTYYGRGPLENYWDRKHSMHVGLYESKVEDLGYEYIRPQENGNRTDIRYVKFADKDGFGLRVEADEELINFTARHNLDEDFDPGLTKKQQHIADIDKRDIVAVNIDFQQRGLGGDNSWGGKPMLKYRLMDKKYTYSYVLRPISD